MRTRCGTPGVDDACARSVAAARRSAGGQAPGCLLLALVFRPFAPGLDALSGDVRRRRRRGAGSVGAESRLEPQLDRRVEGPALIFGGGCDWGLQQVLFEQANDVQFGQVPAATVFRDGADPV